MTRRERLERKLEKRQEWAASRDRKAAAAFGQARSLTDGIPLGQPILVGHHSEKRHRRVLERSDNAMRRGVESEKMAAHHRSAAAGLEHQLDRAIFTDDDNAVAALEERIAEHEAKRDRMKQVNALYRKRDAAGLAALGIDLDKLDARLKEAGAYWGSAPHLPYELTNLGARIRDDRKRIEVVRAQQARTVAARNSRNGVAIEGGDWVRVTFEEKPGRETLNALKAAGFRWGGGSWCGERAKLPACVADAVADVPAAEVQP